MVLPRSIQGDLFLIRVVSVFAFLVPDLPSLGFFVLEEEFFEILLLFPLVPLGTVGFTLLGR